LLSLIITLGGLELFLRYFQASPNYVIKHGWHDYRKNVVNSSGLRDVEHTREKSPGTFRIAFVGDSFTEAWGVQFNKGFSQVLTTMLNETRKDQKYEAIVCAKWGHNSMQELRTYERQCSAFNPDLVIIGYVLNDAEGEKNAPARKEFLYSLRITKPEGKWLWLYDNSALFRFFYLKKEYFRIKRAWIKGYNRMYGNFAGFRDVQRALLEFKRITESKNQKLVVALLPTLDYELSSSNPFIKYYRIMLDFLKDNNIEACYIFPYFKDKNTIELQVNPGYDSHPNETGHQIIAQALYDYLNSHAYLLSR